MHDQVLLFLALALNHCPIMVPTPCRKVWEKMEATLVDMEKCNRATTTFMKGASAKRSSGQVNDLYMKLESTLSKAKTLEVCCSENMMRGPKIDKYQMQ